MAYSFLPMMLVVGNLENLSPFPCTVHTAPQDEYICNSSLATYTHI